MQETWVPVNGWVGLYEISNLGRARSLDRQIEKLNGVKYVLRGRLLKLSKDKEGYLQVGFAKAPIAVKRKVHRLVAMHFLPPSELPEVNHKDLNKVNNVFSNLEWTTRQANQEHARAAGVFDPALNPNLAHKMTPEKTIALRAAHSAGRSYASLGREFGINGRTARKIVLRQTWRSL